MLLCYLAPPALCVDSRIPPRMVPGPSFLRVVCQGLMERVHELPYACLAAAGSRDARSCTYVA